MKRSFKKLKKGTKGITLIALVVTIIVILLLAGISISMLTGDNGIILKSQEAKEQTEIAEEKQVLQQSIMIASEKNVYGNITLENLSNELDDNVGEGKTTVQEEESSFKVTFAESNREYLVDKDGNVEEFIDISKQEIIAKGPWYYEQNGDVTNGTVTLEIESYVYYNASTGAETTSYISSESNSGFFSDQTFILKGDSDYTWQVMGCNEDTGELLIILSDCVFPEEDESGYYLYTDVGYTNYITELDNICSLFGQGNGASKARSITIDDVNKLTGYIPTDTNYTYSSSDYSSTLAFACDYWVASQFSYQNPGTAVYSYCGYSVLYGAVTGVRFYNEHIQYTGPGNFGDYQMRFRS